MPAKKRGAAAQLYRNTGASWASPTWTALKVRDLKWTDMPGNMFEASDRTVTIDTFVPTRTKFKIEFEFLWDASDTGLVALFTAATSGRATPIELICTDDDISLVDTRGVRFMAAIESGFEDDAKLTDGQLVKMSATPHANYANAPARWQTGGAGSGGPGAGSAPTIDSSSDTVVINPNQFVIAGTNFDSTTPGNNLVTFSRGMVGTVTAATSTSLTVTITSKATSTGTMTATVTNGGGTSAATTVATLVGTIAAHWPLNDGSGTTAADVSGNGTNLTLAVSGVGGPVAAWNADTPGGQAGTGGCFSITGGNGGTLGGAATFAAATGGASFPLGNSPRSIAFWFKFSDTTSYGAAGYGPENEDASIFQRGGVGGSYQFIDGANNWAQSNSAPTGAWHHFAITFDGSVMRHYEDGAFVESTTRTLATSAGTGACFVVIVGLAIAKLKDVRLYSTALPQDAIGNLYTP